jgi:hypothetical protein
MRGGQKPLHLLAVSVGGDPPTKLLISWMRGRKPGQVQAQAAQKGGLSASGEGRSFSFSKRAKTKSSIGLRGQFLFLTDGTSADEPEP